MLKRLYAIFATLLITVGFLSTGLAGAATSSGNGQGLEISPPLIDIKTDPGKTVTTQVKVRNVTQETLVVNAQFNDFVANDETGTPKILLKSGDKSPYSIKSWLEAPESVTLSPGERETINVIMNVPADASPGGHYGIVRFTGTPPEAEGGTVALTASVGTLYLVNVSGKVVEAAKIAQIYTSQNNKQSSLFEKGPVLITTRVQNTGNVHFKPKGTIQINNTFGKTVKVIQFNNGERNVLPGSIRKFESIFNQDRMFGKYTAKVDVVYGSENQIASSSVSFWVIPYKTIILVLLIIIVIIVGFRRYNRYIYNKAGKQGGNGSKRKKASK